MEYPVEFNEFIVPRPEGAISATKIRGLAVSKNPEDEQTFMDQMNTIGMDNNEAYRLVKQIRENIDTTPLLTKKKRMRGGKHKRKYTRRTFNKSKKSKKNKGKKKYNK
jgi:hypothetical protein